MKTFQTLYVLSEQFLRFNDLHGLGVGFYLGYCVNRLVETTETGVRCRDVGWPLQNG